MIKSHHWYSLRYVDTYRMNRRLLSRNPDRECQFIPGSTHLQCSKASFTVDQVTSERTAVGRNGPDSNITTRSLSSAMADGLYSMFEGDSRSQRKTIITEEMGEKILWMILTKR